MWRERIVALDDHKLNHDAQDSGPRPRGRGPGCYNFETETLTTDSILECDGHGWVAPACRDDVNACIPIYTYGGYSLSEFRQWATFYNWPTIVIDTTWGGWANAPAMRTASNKPVPFYWWWPDHTFASLAPMRIDLPQHDPMKYAMAGLFSA